MTTAAMRRDIADGAPIVIVPTQHRVVHLPAADRRPAHVGAPVTLDEVLEAGGSPSSWRTLCGDRGGVFVYKSLFYTRVPCEKCMAKAAEEAAVRAAENAAAPTASRLRPEQQKRSANSTRAVVRKEREVV